MNIANIKIGARPSLSTGDLIAQAQLVKSLIHNGDDGLATFMDIFGPTGSTGGDAIAEINQVRGWNWTAILAKSLQFVMADLSVFVRNDIAEQVRLFDPTFSRSADLTSLQGQDIPKNYEAAPDAYILRKLLTQPNPWTSEQFFKFDMAMQLEAHGVCNLLVVPNGNGYPSQLYVIPKALIWAQPATKHMPGGSYRIGRLNRFFMSSEVRTIDADNFQPETLHEAHSWLSDRDYPAKYIVKIGLPGLLWRDEFSNPSKALADTLMIGDAIQKSRKATLTSQVSRGPRLREKEGVTLSNDQKEEYIAKWERENHGSDTEGAPRWASDMFDVENPMDTAREMEYTEGSVENRDSTLGQRMVPPSIVGLGESSGFAAVVGTAKQYGVFTAQPMMDLMAGQLTTGLRQFFQKPKDEFLIKIQTGRIDDEQTEETKLMNDVAATAITVGEFRQARKRKPFGDERDDALAGTLGPNMGNAMDGAAAAAYGEDDSESEQATPGIGAAVQADPAAPSKAEMKDLSRLQFSRNSKGIMEILERVSKGELKKKLAIEFLNMLGVDRERAVAMLDSAEEQQEQPVADDSTPVTIESGSVTKSFGAPIESGLPYVIGWLPAEVESAVEDWKLFINGGEHENPGRPHLTIYGPVLDRSEKCRDAIRAVCLQQPGPLELVVNSLKVFRQPGVDVLVAEVLSLSAKKLHDDLQARIPSPLLSHGFNAHITLAYGSPGSFVTFEGSRLAGVSGQRVTIGEVTFGKRGEIIETFRVGKQAMIDTTASPYAHKSIGMNTTDLESGGALIEPELTGTATYVKVENTFREIFVDKDGERWITLDNGARAKIDEKGGVVAGPPGLQSVKPGAPKAPTSDVTNAPRKPSPGTEPTGADSSKTTVDKPKKARVAKIKDTSPTDMNLSNNDFFVRSYAKVERHLDSRRTNALNAADPYIDQHSDAKIKRVETEMKLERTVRDLNNAKNLSPQETSKRVGEVQKLRTEVETHRQTEKELKQKLHDEFRTALGIEYASMPPKMNQRSLDKSTLRTVDEGVGTVRMWTSDAVLSKVAVDMATIQKVGTSGSIHGDDDLRSFVYDKGQKMALAPGANADVVAHEFGHCIEYSDPKIQKLADGFLKKRVGGEELVQLNTKFPGYGDHEMGRKDDFERVFDEHSAYYIGKYYRDGATEVVSMGLQQLHNDPIKFAENDPEYFNLMVGILQGTLK